MVDNEAFEPQRRAIPNDSSCSFASLTPSCRNASSSGEGVILKLMKEKDFEAVFPITFLKGAIHGVSKNYDFTDVKGTRQTWETP